VFAASLAFATVCGTPAGSTERESRGQPVHWIGVRTAHRVQQLFDRRTGERFVPRGANYQRLGVRGGVRVSGLFSPSSWKPAEIDADLGRMRALGFNVVRSFVDLCTRDCISNGEGLRGAYVANIARFLRMARDRGIAVILASVDVPDRGYLERAPCCSPFGGYRNSLYFSPKGQNLGIEYLTDLVAALREHNAPLQAVMAWEIQQEEFVLSDVPPLSLSSGMVTTADGRTYDMADTSAKRAMTNSNVRLFVRRARTAIRSLDPGALVTMGFFPPLGNNLVVHPKAMLQQSALDFIDFHAYPGGPPMADTAAAFGMSKPTPRPVVMGELGAFRFTDPTAQTGAWELARWQAQSCRFGFDGWVYWLWAGHDVEVYGGTEAGGAINHELSPKARPNPCSAAGIPRNRSLGATATASASIAGHEPSKAIDGLQSTAWIAGGGPPQHLDVQLPATVSVDQIQLLVEQDPAGPTEHRVLVRGDSGGFHLVKAFQRTTEGGDWLVFAPAQAVDGVRTVRIRTETSPSWVAWREIRVYAHASA
jgi:hypothetical protein